MKHRRSKISRRNARVKMSKKGSRRLFTKTAKRVHYRNANRNPMRGGIRL